MSSAPGAPLNPEIIIGDTDALMQLVACDAMGIFKTLRSEYAIRAVIFEAVEIELRGLAKNPKFRDVEHILAKALSSNLLEVCHEKTFSGIAGARGVPFADVESKAKQFAKIGVGRGEAYTHAGGLLLNVPVLTNDSEAIKLLQQTEGNLPGPFLRSFDIVVFAYQIEALSAQDCDGKRQSLAKRGEVLPRCFRDTSFQKGLPEFHQRIADAKAPTVGSLSPIHPYDHKKIFIRSARR